MNIEMIAVLAPFVTGLVEGAKKAGLPDSYAAPAALVFAFALVALIHDDPTSRAAALTAIATGLTASGLYSQAKSYIEQMRTAA